jgi:hypothetical protein
MNCKEKKIYLKWYTLCNKNKRINIASKNNKNVALLTLNRSLKKINSLKRKRFDLYVSRNSKIYLLADFKRGIMDVLFSFSVGWVVPTSE